MGASGARFVADEKLKMRDILELKMLLSPAEPVLVYETGVRVSGGLHGACNVALSFINMDNEVQDRIVYHVLNRQREMAKKKGECNMTEA